LIALCACRSVRAEAHLRDRSRGSDDAPLLHLVWPPRAWTGDIAPIEPPRPTRFEIPSGVLLEHTIAEVRAQQIVDDTRFDAIYPARVCELSSRYWTPVRVARRAAEMLVRFGGTRVLDVGSGAGKFCLVGALTSPGTFVGVEQRAHLVEMAQGIADRYAVTNASYVHGDLTTVDCDAFDAFYFFNPFAENHFSRLERIDSTVTLTPARCEEDLAITFEGLARARLGTRVVTYHGLRGDLPESYERYSCESCGTDMLELWVKVRA
jgi:SAM-dependent methyltransferase